MGIYTKDPDTGILKKIAGGDIQPGTYLTPENIKNNLTTTAGGNALDARQGVVLDEKISAISSDLSDQMDGLEVSIEALNATVADIEESIGDTQEQTAGNVLTSDGSNVQSKLDFLEGEFSNASQGLTMQLGTLEASVDVLSDTVSDLENTVNNPPDVVATDVLTNEDGISVQEKLDFLEESKINAASIANDLTVEDEGSVLDARQGKVLNDKIEAIDTNGGRLFDVLWTGNSAMGAQTIVTYESDKYDVIAVNCSATAGVDTCSGMVLIPVGVSGVKVTISQSEIFWQRGFSASATALSCTTPITYRGSYKSSSTGNINDGSIIINDNNICVPRKVWGIKF